jgi:hypothetical protein
MGLPATRQDRQPLDLPLPRGVWRRIIRAANSKETVTIKIEIVRGKVEAATTEENVRLED